MTAATSSQAEAEQQRWGASSTLTRILTATDHRVIGLRFLGTSVAFFALGGVLALLMRLQLARPNLHLLGPDAYDQVFSTHGTTMMFLFAVPFVQGAGVYLLPLMVGAKNLAFPRLAAYAYWVYLFGGIFLWVALLSNTGPDAGWFSYVPLAGPEYSPGKRADVWAQLVTFTELSALAIAVNAIVTIFKYRAPGMSLDRMPMGVWSQLVTAFMVVFAMPAVMTGSTMLALDRLVGTQFFNPAEGGDPLLWQHVFWFFGHPEVYIIFLPALGFVSEMIVASTRRPVFGYVPLVVANVATALLAFGLWVHHMFATGIPQLGASLFTGASIVISIPTGVQFFCWIASMWGTRPKLSAPFWFVLAFLTTFILGGLTGVMLAAVPIDRQVHDTYFVVAHFHYTLIGGAVFPMLGAIHHWFPKVSGRLLDERLGKVCCALVFVGFHTTFFPQHILGLHGMTRRIYTYSAESGWGTLSLVSTLGAFVLALGILTCVVNAVRAWTSGPAAGENPWDAPSLEWHLSSPPARMEERTVPIVHSRYPLWFGGLGKVTGLHRTEVLVTAIVDAEPLHREHAMGRSIGPLLAALGTTGLIVTCLFTPWGLVLFALPIGAALTAWYWPRRKFIDPERLAKEQP
jgi:cytochrome c oxidase subunit I+III